MECSDFKHILYRFYIGKQYEYSYEGRYNRVLNFINITNNNEIIAEITFQMGFDNHHTIEVYNFDTFEKTFHINLTKIFRKLKISTL